MVRATIISFAWLSLALIYLLVVGNTFSIVFLFMTIGTIIYLAFTVIRTGKQLVFHIEQPSIQYKNEPMNYMLILQQQKKILPTKAIINLKIVHTFTNTIHYQLNEIVLGAKVRAIPIELTLPFAGQYEISIEEIRLTDVIGLFSKRLTQAVNCTSTIMPKAIETSNAQQLRSIRHDGSLNNIDAAHYNGEEFLQLKPYMPGDSIKRIHWKLSSKLDNLYVQQYTLLENDELTVTVDFTNFPGDISHYDKVIEIVAAWLMRNSTNSRVTLVLRNNGLYERVIVSKQDVVSSLVEVMQKTVDELTISQSEWQQLTSSKRNLYIITTNAQHKGVKHITVVKQENKENKI